MGMNFSHCFKNAERKVLHNKVPRLSRQELHTLHEYVQLEKRGVKEWPNTVVGPACVRVHRTMLLVISVEEKEEEEEEGVK